MNDIKPDATAVDTLRSFKFLDYDDVIQNLESEMPAYLAASNGTSSIANPLEWWERHTNSLPHWAQAGKKIVLCQPSSAAVERIFSLLSHFTNFQYSVLEDYTETLLMLQYNKRN